MVPESRHLSHYARVNDKATVTKEAFFSGDDPVCHTNRNLCLFSVSDMMQLHIYIYKKNNVDLSLHGDQRYLSKKSAPACFNVF